MMSMCRVFSCVVGWECLLWPVRSLDKTLSAFVLLHFVLQGQTCQLLHVSWLPSFAFQFPIMKRTSFLVLVLEVLVGLYRTVQLQLLQHYWLGHRLGLALYWMVRLGNKQIILSFLRLHPSTVFQTFVDYNGYSISSKGFLLTVVDIMVIWVKFTHSNPF